MHYRKEIDGLRAIAIVPVVLFHAGVETISGGFLGVDIFFVISGYLITSIILSDMNEGAFSLTRFYERRARRILPALFFVLIVTIPFALFVLTPRDMKDFAQGLVAVSSFSSNMWFWYETDYFTRGSELNPLLHTWSLAVEEQYYILFPIFLLAFWRFGKVKICYLLAVIFLLSLACSQWAAYYAPRAGFYFLPTRGWEILLGSFAAFYFDQKREIPHKIGRDNVLSQLGLILVVCSFFLFDKTTPLPSFYSLFPTIGTVLIIMFAHKGTIVARVLSYKAIVGLGLISYSAYLWHKPLFSLVKHYSLIEPSDYFMAILCLLIIPLSYLSWRFIEQPFRRKNLISQKTVFVSAILMMAIMATYGTYGYLKNGFEDSYVQRFEKDVQPAIKQFTASYEYLDARWESIGSRAFAAAGSSKKVLIIGDSFGRDLVNAIHEVGLDEGLDISVYGVPAHCGHVFSKTDLSAASTTKKPSRCDTQKYYNDSALQKLLSAADEVWLVASWGQQVAELLPTGIQIIQSMTSASIKVWGRKLFGSNVNLKSYLYELNNGNKEFLVSLPAWHVSTNELMEKTLDPSMFINVSKRVCKSDTHCKNTTTAGDIISFDGSHLTKEGAKYVGEVLMPILRMD